MTKMPVIRRLVKGISNGEKQQAKPEQPWIDTQKGKDQGGSQKNFG